MSRSNASPGKNAYVSWRQSPPAPRCSHKDMQTLGARCIDNALLLHLCQSRSSCCNRISGLQLLPNCYRNSSTCQSTCLLPPAPAKQFCKPLQAPAHFLPSAGLGHPACGGCPSCDVGPPQDRPMVPPASGERPAAPPGMLPATTPTLQQHDQRTSQVLPACTVVNVHAQ